MKLATYNVNGVNGRLPVLLRWLEEAEPDVVCLQELKAPDEKFPLAAIEKAGYGAIWHGQKSWNGVAILARGSQPEETRRGLPGDPDDSHSRYIEATVDDLLIGCLYLPNGNPAPGPKFDYKLALVQTPSQVREEAPHARRSQSFWRAITTSSPPNSTPISRSVGSRMRYSFPSRAQPIKSSLPKAGPTPSGSCTLTRRSTRSGITSATRTLAMPASASTISY